jgi:branched-chain amino acid transport system substrate-binding protein
MRISRRQFLGGTVATVGALALPLGRTARAAAQTIKIGVITDMSGIYQDVSGPTSVKCAEQAIAEFTAANPDIAVELLVADHQNKPDVGLTIIRQWFDEEGVDAISNVGNSAIALGARDLLAAKDKVALITTAGSSAITGADCSPHVVHWSWDTWCLAHSTATASVRTGGDKWFFVTADYAFGQASQRDATKFIEAAGGQVVGSVAYPYGSRAVAPIPLVSPIPGPS